LKKHNIELEKDVKYAMDMVTKRDEIIEKKDVEIENLKMDYKFAVTRDRLLLKELKTLRKKLVRINKLTKGFDF